MIHRPLATRMIHFGIGTPHVQAVRISDGVGGGDETESPPPSPVVSASPIAGRAFRILGRKKVDSHDPVREWSVVIKDWDVVHRKKFKYVVELAERGIPTGLRGMVSDTPHCLLCDSARRVGADAPLAVLALWCCWCSCCCGYRVLLGLLLLFLLLTSEIDTDIVALRRVPLLSSIRHFTHERVMLALAGCVCLTC